MDLHGKTSYQNDFWGELGGTFLLVLFGCGAVVVSTIFGAYSGLFQIALSWGIGLTLAIYATRHLSCAHFNPAITLAMALTKRMKVQKVPVYLCGQFLGAFLAGLVLMLLFNPSIVAYESAHGIVRGSAASVATARMFGEFYNTPGGTAVVSLPLAMAAEGFGTFLLALMIFFLTEGCNVGRPDSSIAPIFIGLTVTSLICLLAPLTQAGFNPARDFAPRLVAWLCGWGSAAFPDAYGGFFWVYILAPLVGAGLAGLLFQRIALLMGREKDTCCCQKTEESA